MEEKVCSTTVINGKSGGLSVITMGNKHGSSIAFILDQEMSGK